MNLTELLANTKVINRCINVHINSRVQNFITEKVILQVALEFGNLDSLFLKDNSIVISSVGKNFLMLNNNRELLDNKYREFILYFNNMISNQDEYEMSWSLSLYLPKNGKEIELLNKKRDSFWRFPIDYNFKNYPIDPRLAKIAITGTLNNIRSYYEDMIERYGAEFCSNVTKETNLLIVGDCPGSDKLKKATKYRIKKFFTTGGDLENYLRQQGIYGVKRKLDFIKDFIE